MFTARYGLIAYINHIITMVESVYSAVRTDCLYKPYYNHGGKCLQRGRTDCLYKVGFYNRSGKCLQRGTD
jgi:hypothetical protein